MAKPKKVVKKTKKKTSKKINWIDKLTKKVKNMMESVVTDGTGRYGQVKGYSVAGKTGTSEDGVNTNKYVTLLNYI